MSDAIKLTGLERSTVHRLLSCLVEEQFAEKDPTTKRYRLGLDSLQLGSAAVRRMPLVDKFSPLMKRLARISGDTVFLVARDKDEVVCLHREEGPYPVKVFTINTGERRVIGVGAGGLALLAGLEDVEINEIHARNQAAFDTVGLDRATLWRAVRSTRQTGYSRMVGRLGPAVAGVGAVIPASWKIQAAVSIGTITPRFSATRSAELGELLVASLKSLQDKNFVR